MICKSAAPAVCFCGNPTAKYALEGLSAFSVPLLPNPQNLETAGVLTGNPPMVVLERDFIPDSFDAWGERAIREGWGGYTPGVWMPGEMPADDAAYVRA